MLTSRRASGFVTVVVALMGCGGAKVAHTGSGGVSAGTGGGIGTGGARSGGASGTGGSVGGTGGAASGTGGVVSDTGGAATGGATGPGGTGTGGAAGGAAGPPGGVPWDPWPTIDDGAPPNTCRVTQVGGSTSSTAQRFVQVWEFDRTKSILTKHHVTDGTSQGWNSYVRLDAQGRREIACSAMPPIYCQEWLRDSLGNTKTDGLLQMGNGPFDISIMDPALAPTEARGGEINRYTHTYDAAGRLATTQSFYPGRGAKLVFTRDEQLRCSDVRWEVFADERSNRPAIIEVDHWTYQAGRLVSRVVTNVADPADVRSVITYGYDADGTLASTVVDGYPDIPQPYSIAMPKRDGLADYVVRTVALADGSRWIELLEFRNSNTNAVVMRDGVSTPVMRIRWNLSPGCLALSLPKHTNQDCEFERPFFILPLGWDNPYTTPVPISSPSPVY